ncbi:membrane-associated phospholipid phosphatase [Lipingzhangella halophila]|uniref:Membrane-associated phospholipid phosphatase n=1 Tax=Lipingzhangella halophila TaxID=1783352 RepID=A0A7W7W2L6_9ACTN|nr:phosphatase PAP2 family protein [Lipingzhangella halophila]MBB4930914.1 membrane-associated phospholipid phosphatase [Lipingzhangella halophila]
METLLDGMWDVEVDLVLWLQSLGGWLEPPMRGASFLGSKGLFLLLLPLLFWCVHAGVGARVFLMLMGSSVVNGLLKAIVVGARPYWLHPVVTSMSPEATFGMPSGHTQSAVAVWGYLAAKIRRRWIWPAAATVIVLVALSRVYLGAHFLTDVVAGLAVGAALLWLVLRYERTLLRWWRQRALGPQVGLALAASLVPGVLTLSLQTLVRDGWTEPAEWTGTVPTDPPAATLEYVFMLGGGLFGAMVGFSVLAARGWYSAQGSLISRVTRYVLGMAGIVLILVVAQVAVPGADGAAAAVREYVLYTLIALWGALAAPELFVRMGLATRPESAQPQGVTS